MLAINLFPFKRLLNRKTAEKLLFVVFLAVFLFALAPTLVWAQTPLDAGQSAPAANDPKLIIANIVRIILGFLGVVLTLFIMYGGYVWMTAAGDEAKVEKAKKILRNSIIGLIIILSAFAIVSFIINSLKPGGVVTNGGGPAGENLGLDRWSIGRGPIESVYPAPGQEDVPINTWIAITFKEEINPASLCDDANKDSRCDNEKIKNIEICQLAADGFCATDGGFAAADFINAKVTNRAGDNRTFVIRPNKYLGQEDNQNRQFQVTLGAGIKRLSDAKAILRQPFVWDFTTNGKIDIDPPEILSVNTILNSGGLPSVSGVYPNPDNASDVYTKRNSPTPTQFNFSLGDIKQLRVGHDAAFTLPSNGGGTKADAKLSGVYSGQASGTVTVTIGSDGRKAVTKWPAGLNNYTADYDGGQSIDIGPYGLNFSLTGQVNPGNSWTFQVTAYQAGDQIQLLYNNALVRVYVLGRDIDIKTSDQADVAIKKITDKILSDNSAVFAACGAACVQTKISGSASGHYAINATGEGLAIAAAKGADATKAVKVFGQSDAFRNSIIQINFNEPVNPAYLDNLVVKYGKSGQAGQITETVSGARAQTANQYRTLEIKGPTECGKNSCGDPIYCWPTNDLIAQNPEDYSHKATPFEVTVGAATLMNCQDALCGQWGGACDTTNRCAKNIGDKKVFNPVADFNNINGLVDMAGNSFNGNFDYYLDNDKVVGLAQGQSGSGPGHSGLAAYVLNKSQPLYAPSAKFGDDFSWSFWLSDEIDNQPPLLEKIGPAGMRGDEQTANAAWPVEVMFDRLMSAVSLKTGWGYGASEREKTQRFMALNVLTPNANPIGYWIDALNYDHNNDHLPDKTLARISHTLFDDATEYSPLIGSGVTSITQNCFLPSAGPLQAGDGVCRYQDKENLAGCANVQLNNPASYAYLKCEQIDNAAICQADEVCQALYYQPSDKATDLAGSWVLAKDFDRGADFENKTGCCLGLCVKKSESKK